MTPAIKKDANVTNNTKRDAATIEAALEHLNKIIAVRVQGKEENSHKRTSHNGPIIYWKQYKSLSLLKRQKTGQKNVRTIYA